MQPHARLSRNAGLDKCLMAAIFTFDLGHGHFESLEVLLPLNVTSRIRTISCALIFYLSIAIMNSPVFHTLLTDYLETVQSAYCSQLISYRFLSSTKLIILIYATNVYIDDQFENL